MILRYQYAGLGRTDADNEQIGDSNTTLTLNYTIVHSIMLDFASNEDEIR